MSFEVLDYELSADPSRTRFLAEYVNRHRSQQGLTEEYRVDLSMARWAEYDADEVQEFIERCQVDHRLAINELGLLSLTNAATQLDTDFTFDSFLSGLLDVNTKVRELTASHLAKEFRGEGPSGGSRMTISPLVEALGNERIVELVIARNIQSRAA